MDKIRQSITRYKGDEPCVLLVRFRQQLHAALRQRWQETRSKPGVKQ